MFKFLFRGSRHRSAVIEIKHQLFSIDLANCLAQAGPDEEHEFDSLTKSQVETLVRDSLHARGSESWWFWSDDYEEEEAEERRAWVTRTIRRLWPELDDDQLRQFAHE